MAELKIHITADTQNATQGVSKVTDSIESLRKAYIKSGAGFDSYIERVNTQLSLIAGSNEGMKSLEKQYALITKELTWMERAYGSSSDAVKMFAAAQSSLKDEMDRTTEVYRQQKAAVEAQKASMAKVEEQYRLIIEHEKERAKAIEDANNAAIESWRRYTEFAAAQQAKLDSIQDANNSKAQSASASAYAQRYDTSIGSTSNDMAFYDAIGDSAAKARLELSMYEQQLRRVLASENASPAAIDAATEAYRQQKAAVEELDNAQTKQNSKFADIFKNILKFQLVMKPIQKTIRFVSDTITDSMKVAAEAEQVFNKLSTVFENNAAAMGRAQQMAQSYGTSISTMASSLSTVGDLLQAQGMGRSSSLDLASEWTAAFSDIIAFKDINMTVEEFAQNFMSGAAGNLRNFRTFGSVVKETAVNAELARRGLSDLTGEELELQKMVIRATMALDQQRNAIGATEREWDTVLSINRRLNEQWKQFKENIGERFNEALSPVKSWLSDILTVANKVTAAVNEIDSGEFTIKTKAIASGDELEKIVKKLVKNIVITSENIPEGLSERQKNAIAKLNKQGSAVSGQARKEYELAGLTPRFIADMAKATGASIDDLAVSLEDAGYDLVDDIYEKAQELYDADIARINRQDARTKQLQALEESVLQEYRDNLTSMFTNTGDMESWLVGNSFVDHTSAEFVLGRNTGTIEENATQGASEIAAILNYMRTTTPKMSTYRTDLQGQLAAAQSSFDEKAVVSDGIAWSRGNGWSDAEAKEQYKLIQRLERQIAAIDATTDTWTEMDETLSVRLKELYEQKEKETASDAVTKATTELAASNASDAKRLELEKQYTDEMSYMVDIFMQEYEYGLKYAEMQKSLMDAGYTELEATKLLSQYKEEYAKALEASKAAEVENVELERTKGYNAFAKAFGSLWSEGKSYSGAYSDVEKWGDDRLADAAELAAEALENGYIGQEKYNDIIEWSRKKIEAESIARANLVDRELVAGMFGETGSLVDQAVGLAQNGTGFMGGDLVSFLVEIASQLEVVQTISSFIGDYIIPILDSFLEPMLPLIETIGGLVQSIVQGVLVPLFPIIVEVSALLTLVVGTVKAGIDFVVNSIKWVIGNLAVSLLKALDKLIPGNQSSWYGSNTWMGQWAAINPFDEFDKTMNETLETVKDIRSNTLNIADNTKNDDVDLSLLNELLAAGVIDEAGYNARAKVKQAGLSWDTVKPTKEGYMDFSNRQTTVSKGNVTVVINGGDPDDVKKAVASALKEAGMDPDGMGYQDYA